MSKPKRNKWVDLIALDTLVEGPAYVQISRRIESLILDGELKPGDTLPSERVLAEALNVSRITTQHAYNELRRRRLILSQGRRGSIIQAARPRITTPMNRLRGFTEEMQALGRIPSSRILEQTVLRDADAASTMGIPFDSLLMRLKRVRYADGVPMSKELAWYNLAQAPFLENTDPSGSIYAVLAAHNLTLASCDQVIQVVMADTEDERIFGFPSPTPCMLIKRRSFTAQGIMLEYVEGRFRGDVYSYRLTLGA